MSALYAQQEPTLNAQAQAEYNFGQAMRFSLTASGSSPITRATLYMHAPNLPNTLTAEIGVEPADEIEVTRVVDLTELRLAPFTTVTYWWTVEFDDGESADTERQTIAYVDDQFSWQSLSADGVEIYWTGDDQDTGQTALDAVLNALPDVEALIPVARPDAIRIFVYPSAADLRSALRLTGRDWVGAHAHPELGVILVSAGEPLLDKSDLAQNISHELAHLFLYTATGDAYESTPVWLDEGLAGLVEVAPNPNYATRLEEALANDETIAFGDLCYALPDGEDQVLLAYAQSTSLVEYLQSEYGDQVLSKMIAAIADGAECQSVTVRELGISLAELNQDWLDDAMPQNILERAWRNGRGWLLFLAAGFLLIGLLVGLPRAARR